MGVSNGFEQAFDDGLYRFEWKIFWSFSIAIPSFSDFCADECPAVPAAEPNVENGDQLMTLCWSICAAERAQLLEPVKSLRCCLGIFHEL